MSVLRCAFLGSSQQLVACAEHWLARGHLVVQLVSSCPIVKAWAQPRGIPLGAPTEDIAALLGGVSYDYLFSVVNHAITSPEVMKTAGRAAINYHDSPLPSYSGFNATAWAILDGQTRHGVTWHEMTAEVDGGRILVQQSIEIRDDDTAFTLGVKAAEAGVESFAGLVAALEASVQTGNALKGTPQGARESFHFRSDRPGLGLLDVEGSAQALSAQVRGLNFGPEDNWMCTAKLLLPGGLVSVSELRIVADEGGPRPPAGTVTALSERGVEVSVADALVCFSDLRALDGASLSPAELSTRYGVGVGLELGSLARELVAQARVVDPSWTKHERFWVRRLLALQSPNLPELVVHHAAPVARQLARVGAEDAAIVADPAAIVAALALYLARVSDMASFDLAYERALTRELAAAYAQATPLRCEVDLAGDFAKLEAQVRSELALSAEHHIYARDVPLRYRALRERGARPSPCIGVRFSGDHVESTARLVEGTQLTLVVARDGRSHDWIYDQQALSAAAVATLAARIDTILEGARAAAQRPVGELALSSADERTKLMSSWQGAALEYAADACIHELFARQVALTPEAVAVVFRDATLTYRELDARANGVAARLRAEGVGPEVLVGICVERSLDMIVALLGTLKAGGAYVPLDPVYPRERLAMMLEDANAQVLLTQRSMAHRLPAHRAQVLFVEDLRVAASEPPPGQCAGPDNLAYVIFTSGSTGRPKGVMVQHRNVSNFFTGMDAVIGTERGTWLAVTSISFDISVLELFWTLTRGFKVVIQEENDRASLAESRPGRELVVASQAPMDFGLFYFAADSGSSTPGENAYRLLTEGARFADEHGFSAVWTPERHFHKFGGLYPNPAITTAALSTITRRVALRAGSVVLPLHDPLRVAEDWSMIDQLSGGRVGLSFASGWHVNDFAFKPENYERRREVMVEHIETVLKLWRGEKISVQNGVGQPIEVAVLPRPIQARPPIWIASAGSVDTFKLAGKLGANVLTNMLGQDLADLKVKLAAYRSERQAHGHEGPGQVSVMLHTYVCGDDDEAREVARKPFCDYLASSFDLVKVAPWMFPAFRQPSLSASQDTGFSADAYTAEDMDALLEHAFQRYFDTAGLFGTPERALGMVEQLKRIGVDEVACLIDFGIDSQRVLESLPHLARLRELSNPGPTRSASESRDYTLADQLRAHAVTHLQCTPSLARMLLVDEAARAGLGSVRRMMLGGEALPGDLVAQLAPLLTGEILNMYGPTETTVWSTVARIDSASDITIGRPIANTVIRILDPKQNLSPVGTPGEICIGGAGVVRGYLGRPDLTRERFVPDPFAPGQFLYRTGDLGRHLSDGRIAYIGRIDHQVKVNGYRIELGEIEAVLARHASVRQSVVVARSDGAAPQLVAYVVPAAGGSARESGDGELVKHWQSLWDETYRQADTTSALDPRFNTAGWNDSYTGAPIPQGEMEEWLSQTVQRVLSLAPKRVLEVGCGTGLVLYRLLGHVEHYTAVDLSPHALETIRGELVASEASKVTLVQQPAHALAGLSDRSCDTVVINSVIQYFPDAAYLRRVLTRASELVADGGHIFVGDVRSLAQLEAFHTLVELNQAPSHLGTSELGERVRRRVRQESELVLSEAFFHGLVGSIPRISGVEVRIKAGRADNEMNWFRYDVILHVGPRSGQSGVAPSERSAQSVDQISELLEAEPSLLVLTDLRNARLSSVFAALAAIEARAPGQAEELRRRCLVPGREGEGIDPSALITLHPSYEVDLGWAASGAKDRFDVCFRHRQHGPAQPLLFTPSAQPGADANVPAALGDDALKGQLREHLREFLPAYMIPAAIVVLESLPLTPNGKIDRNALPAPDARPRASDVEHQPPGNAMEKTISEVWQQMLGLERVGRKDNVFDLGANSLLVVQANQRLASLLERKISLVSMFRFPTIEALAGHLAADQPAAARDDARAQKSVDRKKDAAARRRELRDGRS